MCWPRSIHGLTEASLFDEALGQLARDQANLANAKVDLAGSLPDAGQAERDLQSAARYPRPRWYAPMAALSQADQANVENARINLGYTNIVSPVAGRVGVHLVDIGNIVTAGQSDGIVVVTQLQPMSVLFTIPEDIVSDARDGAGERGRHAAGRCL